VSEFEKIADRVTSLLPGWEKNDRPVVGVVRLQGVITASGGPLNRGVINVTSVESALHRAFNLDRLVAVALIINSPGGSPTQSALVAERIRELAAEKEVPVLAFCEDTVASGGYWIACAADEIYAHSTSIVGSIGVVSAGFGLEGLIDKLGVERRVHTAGTNKVRLDAFQPEKAEDVEWLGEIHTQLHDLFIGWVKERRPAVVDKLKATPELADTLFSGEIYTGAKAAEVGLVDGVGSLRQIVNARWDNPQLTATEPRKSLLTRIGVNARAEIGLSPQAWLAAIEERAQWSRFGL
jgi:signal peptide peptidase SppA